MKGIYTINTPKTQAAMGWIGGEKLRLGDTDFEVKTRSATVVVQSLDDAPIFQSKQILISLGARAVPKEREQDALPCRTGGGEIVYQSTQGA